MLSLAFLGVHFCSLNAMVKCHFIEVQLGLVLFEHWLLSRRPGNMENRIMEKAVLQQSSAKIPTLKNGFSLDLIFGPVCLNCSLQKKIASLNVSEQSVLHDTLVKHNFYTPFFQAITPCLACPHIFRLCLQLVHKLQTRSGTQGPLSTKCSL